MKQMHYVFLMLLSVTASSVSCYKYIKTDHNWWLVWAIILLVLAFRSMWLAMTVDDKKAGPEFKRAVENYKADLSLVDTPEKAMENFSRCLILFKSLCRAQMSKIDKMSLEEVMEYRDKSVSSIEANYLNGEVSSWGIRARLHIPCMDETHCGEYAFLKDHIPVLTTGDHLIEEKEIFDYFVYQFIKEGIVVRFQI